MGQITYISGSYDNTFSHTIVLPTTAKQTDHMAPHSKVNFRTLPPIWRN